MDRAFRKAAAGALVEWSSDLSPKDLVNELWVWYLESPKVQLTLSELHPNAVSAYLRRVAQQVLSKNALSGDKFNGRTLYSSESVKDALKGESTNRYLNDILPIAMKQLDKRNPGHAEAIRSRYQDRLIPAQGAPAALLTNAHKALTEQINIIVITVDNFDQRGSAKTGPGSRAAVFPDTRKARDSHADPTGDTAIALIENPAYRDDYLEESGPGVEVLPIPGGRVVDHSLIIFDGVFNGMGGIEMYRSWVIPEMFPRQPRPRLSNWPVDDLEMYVGAEYAKAAHENAIR